MKIILLLGIMLATAGCLNSEANETPRTLTSLKSYLGSTYQCRAIVPSAYNASCIDLVDCYVDGAYAQRIVCATNVIVR